MSNNATALERLDDGTALIVLDHPERSANLLSSSVLDEIEAHLDTISKEDGVSGLVFVSRKPAIFIAGADLTEFVAGLDRSEEEIIGVSTRGQQLFARLAELPFPTIAAINGICVGGGAELAVWCDRRIVTDDPKTTIGFPEVKLGLFPGWGGTARLPRMIGLANAVEMITGGESISARETIELGLAKDLVETREPDGDEALIAAAQRMIASENASKQYVADRERWSQPISQSETELAFLGATANAVIQQKTKGHYPAPMAALEVMLEASQVDLASACEIEAKAFAPLFGSPVNRALLNVFFLTDRAKKTESGSGDERIPQSASVLGAGTMGQGIAAANIKRGIPVLLSDAREQALARGIEGVVREAAFNKATRETDADRAIEMAARVGASTSPEQLAGSDVVIEAIYEDADAKTALFTSLEPHLGDEAVLCSNTSTIPITALAAELKHPERFCGLHFFNPVRKMPLIEVIRGEKTSDDTVASMAAYSRKLGKTPVIVNDGPGFLVNRLLMPYMAEAALMASEGVSIKEIEKAAKRFGMPMGPLELHDVVGLDVCLHAGGVMQRAFPDRAVEVPLVEKLVKADRLGQKNGKGFFDYPPSKPGRPPKGVPSPELAKLVEAEPGGAKTEECNLTDRLLLPMLLEATRALYDGIVSDPRDVDLALILGIGFPPHRGGLLFWADQIGAAKMLKKLEPLTPLGKRFEPTAMLKEKAAKESTFY